MCDDKPSVKWRAFVSLHVSSYGLFRRTSSLFASFTPTGYPELLDLYRGTYYRYETDCGCIHIGVMADSLSRSSAFLLLLFLGGCHCKANMIALVLVHEAVLQGVFLHDIRTTDITAYPPALVWSVWSAGLPREREVQGVDCRECRRSNTYT